jgi:heme exporter protein A
MSGGRLEAKELFFGRDDRPLLAGLSFAADGGEMVEITGANGAGKTSLIKILCGLILPDGGAVLWGGKNIRRDAESYRQAMAYVGHKDGVKGDLTPRENLSFAAAANGIRGGISAALEKWNLNGITSPCRLLSAGQRRRVALARLLLSPARLWLLDEPLTALDEAGRRRLGEVAQEHLRGGGVVVMSSHHRPEWGIATRTVALGG